MQAWLGNVEYLTRFQADHITFAERVRTSAAGRCNLGLDRISNRNHLERIAAMTRLAAAFARHSWNRWLLAIAVA